MSRRTKSKVTSTTKKTGLVEISYLPDFERFGFTNENGEPGYTKDFISLLKRHAYDCALHTGLKVTFIVHGPNENAEKISVKNLTEYAKLYVDEKTNLMAFESENCHVVLTEQIRKDAVKRGFRHVSFVNNQMTKNGGIHVDKWIKSLLGSIRDHMNRANGTKGQKKKKDEAPKIKLEHMKKYFFIFVSARIDDQGERKYEGQSKHELKAGEVTTSKLTEAQIKKILKWEFSFFVQEEVKHLDLKKILKGDARKRRHFGEKVHDANFAETKQREDCFLLVCEGDSAMTTAIAGRSAIEGGSDLIGIMPIRGKIINASNNSEKAVGGNKEIQLIRDVLGIEYGVDYSNPEARKRLRYGKGLYIFSDQDTDGFHIAGLIMNFFHRNHPELVAAGLVNYVNTPVIQVFLKDKTVRPYYSYASYKRDFPNPSDDRIRNVRYFKGLGTWSNEGAVAIFEDLKVVKCVNDGNEEYFMDLGFDDNYADKRKEWLLSYDPNGEVCEINEEGEFVVKETEIIEGEQSLSDFVDHKLVIYHKDNVDRSLPDVADGFKEGQRKIIKTCFDKKITSLVKVAQIAGSVNEYTVYHHGETSLHDTIIKQAQGFVGARNIPLLVNDGQFGSRMQGGKDHASARYIFTHLERIAFSIFKKEDEDVLEKVIDEGKEYEPVRYAPVVPMILINGIKAISSGWSTTIPPYDPEVLVRWVRLWISKRENSDSEDETYPELIPWWRGFKGRISIKNRSVYTEGILEADPNRKNVYHITELPIGLWTSEFKAHIEEKFMADNKHVVKLDEYHTPNSVHFTLKAHADFQPDADTNFKKLKSSIAMTNMFALRNGKPKKYETPEEILEDFCEFRYEIYGRRKEHLLKEYRTELDREMNRKRFIEEVISEELVIENRDERELFDEMKEKGYSRYYVGKSKNGYAYLVDMPMRSVTKQKIEALEATIAKLEEKINTLDAKTLGMLWIEDLDEFDAAYQTFLKTRKDDIEKKRKKKKLNVK